MRRGALLLEVLVSLMILALALGLLGGQLIASLRMIGESETQVRAAQFADRLLALLEMDPTLEERFFIERNADGDFGDANPGWFWRARVEDTDVQGLGALTLDILYQPDPRRQRDRDDAPVVRSLHMLKANPALFNLVRDAGLDPNLLAGDFSGLPGGGAVVGDGSGMEGPGGLPGLPGGANPLEALAALIAVLPPGVIDANGNFDPRALAQLSIEELMGLLPALMPLMQQFGGGLGLGLAPAFGGAGGDGTLTPEQIQGIISQGLRPPGGRPGGAAGAGRPAGPPSGAAAQPPGDRGGGLRDDQPKAPAGTPSGAGASVGTGGRTIRDLNRDRGGSRPAGGGGR